MCSVSQLTHKACIHTALGLTSRDIWPSPVGWDIRISTGYEAHAAAGSAGFEFNSSGAAAEEFLRSAGDNPPTAVGEPGHGPTERKKWRGSEMGAFQMAFQMKSGHLRQLWAKGVFWGLVSASRNTSRNTAPKHIPETSSQMCCLNC